MMVYPDSQVVDKDDQIIGQMQLLPAMKAGAILRVSRLFLLNSNKQMLLQKRSQFVLAPGLWCEAAAGHVDAGESYETTVVREAEEEINLNLSEYEEIDYSLFSEKYAESTIQKFEKVYLSVAPQNWTPKHDEHEVEALAWVSLDDLAARMSSSPEEFTPGFIFFMQRFIDKHGADYL